MLWSSSSGTHVTPPTSLTVPARSQYSVHSPGVVGRGVVVVVVVLVVVVVVVVVLVVELLLVVAVLAISSSFSRGMGVVDGVGQPVNSVVAL